MSADSTKHDAGDLRARARAAYEASRWRAAGPWALSGVAIGTLGAALGSDLLACVAVAAVIGTAAVLLRWWGREPGRAVPMGLVGATVALALPAVAMRAGHLCAGGVCTSWCQVLCAGGGFALGGLLVWTGRRDGRRLARVVTGVGLTSLGSLLGCTAFGTMGLVGLALGLASSIPLTWIAVPSRAR